MSNAGVLLEFRGNKAIVFTDDLNYIYLKRKDGMRIGQKIMFTEQDVIDVSRGRKNIQKTYRTIAGIAAMLVVSILIYMSLAKPSINIYAYVDVDINPSLELAINHSGIVMDVLSLNEDANKLDIINQIKGMEIKNAINTIIDDMKNTSFDDDQKKRHVLISYAITSDKDNTKDLTERLDYFVNKKDPNIVVEIIETSMSDKEQATKNGISMGKQKVFDLAIERGLSPTIEEIRGYHAEELIEIIDMGKIINLNPPSEISTNSTNIQNVGTSVPTPAVSTEQSSVVSPTPTPSAITLETEKAKSVDDQKYGNEVKIILLDSRGNGLAGGKIKYYVSSWIEAGITDSNGVYVINLPEGTTYINVRLEYDAGRQDIRQNINEDPVVIFRTIDTVVKLIDSNNEGIDGGWVRYSSWTWKDFGTTSEDGTVHKELLPGEYNFRLEYEAGRQDIRQNITENPMVAFRTIDTVVKLIDSNNEGIDGGWVRYSSWTWKDFGMTSEDGMVHKELLPGTYTFRITYQKNQWDIKQNIFENSLVEFISTEQ